MEEEVLRLLREKEELMNEQLKAKEIKRLKKEIWYLKNPFYITFTNIFKSFFNILANIGDNILKFLTQKSTQPQTIRSYKQPKQQPQPKQQVDVMKSMEQSMKNVDDIISKFDDF